MILVIRVCSILLVAPLFIVLRYDPQNEICYENWDDVSQTYYTVTVFFVGYAIPLAIIVVGYCCIVREIVGKR